MYMHENSCFLASTAEDCHRVAEKLNEWANASNSVVKAVGFDLEWHIADDLAHHEGRAGAFPCFMQLAIFTSPQDAVTLTGELGIGMGPVLVAGAAEYCVVPIVIDSMIEDCPPAEQGRLFAPLFAHNGVVKIAWAIKEDAMHLATSFGITVIRPCVDIQLLALSSKQANYNSSYLPMVWGLKKAFEEMGMSNQLEAKSALDLKADGASEIFLRRPVEPHVLAYMMCDVNALWDLFGRYETALKSRFNYKDSAARLEDVRRGTQTLLTFHETVPYLARQHGVLPVGVLNVLHPVPRDAHECITCRRPVAPKHSAECDTCVKVRMAPRQRRSIMRSISMISQKEEGLKK